MTSRHCKTKHYVRPGRSETSTTTVQSLPAQVSVQVGVADVEPEGPSRGAWGGLVDLQGKVVLPRRRESTASTNNHYQKYRKYRAAQREHPIASCTQRNGFSRRIVNCCRVAGRWSGRLGRSQRVRPELVTCSVLFDAIQERSSTATLPPSDRPRF
jgi:hypothetical protein